MVTRRAFLGAFLALGQGERPRGFTVTGKLTAALQEAQEGYYALGQEFALVTKPDSPVHAELRAMQDREVQCSVFTT